MQLPVVFTSSILLLNNNNNNSNNNKIPWYRRNTIYVQANVFYLTGSTPGLLLSRHVLQTHFALFGKNKDQMIIQKKQKSLNYF